MHVIFNFSKHPLYLASNNCEKTSLFAQDHRLSLTVVHTILEKYVNLYDEFSSGFFHYFPLFFRLHGNSFVEPYHPHL